MSFAFLQSNLNSRKLNVISAVYKKWFQYDLEIYYRRKQRMPLIFRRNYKKKKLTHKINFS